MSLAPMASYNYVFMNAIVLRGSTSVFACCVVSPSIPKGASIIDAADRRRSSRLPRLMREFLSESRRSYSAFSLSIAWMRLWLPSIHFRILRSHSSRGCEYFALAAAALSCAREDGLEPPLDDPRDPGLDPGLDDPGLLPGLLPAEPGRDPGSSKVARLMK